MVDLRRWHRIALAGFLVAAIISWFRWAPQPIVQPKAKGHAALKFPIVGTASCAGGGCHGSFQRGHDPARCQQDEYLVWTQDRHAHAYHTLLSERSRRIAQALGGQSPAHENKLCLACHTNPLIANLPSDHALVQQERRFGVGCESCHGSAHGWLTVHAGPNWRREKPRHSMPDLADATVQAKACAGCHVGAPASNELPRRDVNHDLIVAGHPPLRFEFGAYRANMPAHWRPRKSSDAAHHWVVGQIVAAEAALALTRGRAQEGPWPEFAEHDCFACHHALAAPGGRRRPGSLKRGVLPWGSWHFALTRELMGELPALDALAKEMQTGRSERTAAAEGAKNALTELRQRHAKLAGAERSFGTELARRRIVDRLGNGELAVHPCWDSVEQLYLGLHAIRPAPALAALAHERAFLDGCDSPTALPPEGHRPFDPLILLEKLRTLAR